MKKVLLIGTASLFAACGQPPSTDQEVSVASQEAMTYQDILDEMLPETSGEMYFHAGNTLMHCAAESEKTGLSPFDPICFLTYVESSTSKEMMGRTVDICSLRFIEREDIGLCVVGAIMSF